MNIFILWKNFMYIVFFYNFNIGLSLKKISKLVHLN